MGRQTRQSGRWVRMALGIVVLAAIPLAAYDLDLVEPVASSSLYYSDGRIQIAFALRQAAHGAGKEGIAFTIRNLTGSEIEIDWNRSGFWLPGGQMSGVIHAGVRFIQAETYLPPTVIPSGRTLSDFVIPTRSIYPSVIGWRVRPLDLSPRAQLGLFLSVRGRSLPESGYDFVFQAANTVEETRSTRVLDVGHWLLAAVAAMYVGTLL